MRWCDRHDVGYLLGWRRTRVSIGRAPGRIRPRRQFEATGVKQRIFAEFRYAAADLGQTAPGDRQGRAPARGAQHALRGDQPARRPAEPVRRACTASAATWRTASRSSSWDLFADRTSCHAFLANQFRVLLSAAAYVLVETLRRVGLKGTELESGQVNPVLLSGPLVVPLELGGVDNLHLSRSSNSRSKSNRSQGNIPWRLLSNPALRAVGPNRWYSAGSVS